ncbi:xanthine dehydrogenase [Acetobacter aceti 1023]|nr:xanthine dehydrogenase [Acetobacter aceti 1023]
MQEVAGVLQHWHRHPEQLILVRVTETKGSTPRETGAFMLVGTSFLAGTVGGGALEYECVSQARQMLCQHEKLRENEFILGGQNTNQCCGGWARVRLERVTPDLARDLENNIRHQLEARPTLLMFGAGHVGRALAYALAPLPLRLIWIDPRAEEFGNVPPGVETHITNQWEALLRAVPVGAGVLVLTPSHTLDALIVEAALLRNDLSYVGLIGSATKRRRFEHSFRQLGMEEARLQSLICPIGERGIKDKRPEVIAALVAAEVVEHVLHPSQ